MFYDTLSSFSALCAIAAITVKAVDPFLCDDIRSDKSMDANMTIFRLPNTTRPVSYELNIMPDYDNYTDAVSFDGEVEIVFYATSLTALIILNYKELDVFVVYVREKNTNMPVYVINTCYNSSNEQLAIMLRTELRPDVQYAMVIEYRGIVKNGMNGFYRSTYNTEYGFREWLFATYFEPTGARQIFPCYDEPAFKTPYNITLTRPRYKSVRSNMPNSTTVYDESIREMRDVFVETSPMSTHMVAFVVSGFGQTANEGVSLSSAIYTFTRPDYLDHIQLVSNEAPRLLKAMEDFTESRYQLPKLDLFAVPDFKSDAIGNWGLNIYREKYLLLNNVSSTKAKESGLSMVQREIARQWFGNLVTCLWWDYLWMHVAFITYFQYFAMHLVYPDWRMNHMFVVEQHQMALVYDQMPRRPITASVHSPMEINEAFYDQTPKKASAFLRMLKYVTNDIIFQQSLVLYLKENKYRSVEPDALFTAFESTISKQKFNFGGDNVTITSFMKQWTEQAGYPMINVLKVNNEFIINQERFLIDTPIKQPDPTKWSVGITLTTESSKNFDNFTVAIWCKPTDDPCIQSAPIDSGWYIFNIQSTGFYRVNYDEENWRSIIRQLKTSPTEINVLNRAQLIDDSFNLARADKLHYSIPLKLSSYLKMEDDVLPWYSAINGYSYILERMRRDDVEYSQMRECVSDLAGTIYKKIEDLVVIQNNTDHIILTSWNEFSVWTCGLNNTICTHSALEYYTQWRSGEMIPTDIRDAAFCVGIRVTNNNYTWNEMLYNYKTTKSPSEKQAAQTALACTEDKQLLSKYLNFIFYNGPIRPQDYRDVFIAVSSTPDGLDVLIDFLIQNLNKIVNTIVDGEEIVTFIYSLCASKVALENEIARIKNLKDDQNTPKRLKEKFNRSYEQVTINLYWYNKYHDIVSKNNGCSPKYTTTDNTDQPTTIMYTKLSTKYTKPTRQTESTTHLHTESMITSSTTELLNTKDPSTTIIPYQPSKITSTTATEKSSTTYDPYLTSIELKSTTTETTETIYTKSTTSFPEPSTTEWYTVLPQTSTIHRNKTTETFTTSNPHSTTLQPKSSTTQYTTYNPQTTRLELKTTQETRNISDPEPTTSFTHSSSTEWSTIITLTTTVDQNTTPETITTNNPQSTTFQPQSSTSEWTTLNTQTTTVEQKKTAESITTNISHSTTLIPQASTTRYYTTFNPQMTTVEQNTTSEKITTSNPEATTFLPQSSTTEWTPFYSQITTVKPITTPESQTITDPETTTPFTHFSSTERLTLITQATTIEQNSTPETITTSNPEATSLLPQSSTTEWSTVNPQTNTIEQKETTESIATYIPYSTTLLSQSSTTRYTTFNPQITTVERNTTSEIVTTSNPESTTLLPQSSTEGWTTLNPHTTSVEQKTTSEIITTNNPHTTKLQPKLSTIEWTSFNPQSTTIEPMTTPESRTISDPETTASLTHLSTTERYTLITQTTMIEQKTTPETVTTSNPEATTLLPQSSTAEGSTLIPQIITIKQDTTSETITTSNPEATTLLPQLSTTMWTTLDPLTTTVEQRTTSEKIPTYIPQSTTVLPQSSTIEWTTINPQTTKVEQKKTPESFTTYIPHSSKLLPQSSTTRWTTFNTQITTVERNNTSETITTSNPEATTLLPQSSTTELSTVNPQTTTVEQKETAESITTNIPHSTTLLPQSPTTRYTTSNSQITTIDWNTTSEIVTTSNPEATTLLPQSSTKGWTTFNPHTISVEHNTTSETISTSNPEATKLVPQSSTKEWTTLNSKTTTVEPMTIPELRTFSDPETTTSFTNFYSTERSTLITQATTVVQKSTPATITTSNPEITTLLPQSSTIEWSTVNTQKTTVDQNITTKTIITNIPHSTTLQPQSLTTDWTTFNPQSTTVEQKTIPEKQTVSDSETTTSYTTLLLSSIQPIDTVSSTYRSLSSTTKLPSYLTPHPLYLFNCIYFLIFIFFIIFIVLLFFRRKTMINK